MDGDEVDSHVAVLSFERPFSTTNLIAKMQKDG
jgi:hypothetical protein